MCLHLSEQLSPCLVPFPSPVVPLGYSMTTIQLPQPISTISGQKQLNDAAEEVRRLKVPVSS